MKREAFKHLKTKKSSRFMQRLLSATLHQCEKQAENNYSLTEIR